MRNVKIKTFFGWCIAFAMLASLGSCYSYSGSFPSDRVERQAIDVPDHFLVGSPNSTETAEPVAGEGCRNPMVDSRDGTRLSLVRSGAAQGDYEVPAGRYGVSEGELLRLDCETGRVLGVVKR